MPGLDRVPDRIAALLRSLPLPEPATTPFVAGGSLADRRVAIVTTAGLYRRGESGFAPYATDHRSIPGDVAGAALLLGHLSVNFDRSGFQQDVNVIFPIERLDELARAGEIGSVASSHYSLPGGSDPADLMETIAAIVGQLQRDGVDAVLLVPV
ncbi:MAG: selenoprotein B glycine/betaine/sarcosine/D-proline reductase [Deltaproteobacteria bacterium]|nr:selenoprotein B glycine/betaine/sarcosine/D-proline reductase [Deltaproteobacteria bacterium]MBW2417433.1 selenoprotein B glycine/betaine/sarcosine/D-proline reductase [Deltaproteobacteria bacterium]